MRRGVGCRVAGCGVAALVWAMPGAAWAAQDGPPRYAAAMLRTAAFDEQTRLTIRTQTGTAVRVESVGRDAHWEIRLAGDSPPFAIEAWYEALRLWREGPGGRLVPDTDALVGGRFLGLLAADGVVTLTARPFLPDEIAEVSDLRQALATLLPRLPPTALAPGARWADTAGWTVARLEDSVVTGHRLARYRWSHHRADTTRAVEADTLPYTVRTVLREQGQFAWHPTHGPVAWQRTSLVELEIPADSLVRRPVRTRVEERVEVRRRAAGS